MIFFFFLVAWERSLLAFFLNIQIAPFSIHTALSHLVRFILLKERCSPLLILFQRATLSQPQQPCQEKQDERLEHGYLEISKNVQPQLKMQKEAGAGGVSSSGCLVTTNKSVTEGLLSWGSTSSWAFGTRHPSEWWTFLSVPHGEWQQETIPGKSSQCSDWMCCHLPLRIPLL